MSFVWISFHLNGLCDAPEIVKYYVFFLASFPVTRPVIRSRIFELRLDEFSSKKTSEISQKFANKGLSILNDLSQGTNLWIKDHCSMWTYWSGHYLNGGISGEPSHSTLAAAQNRCHELGAICNAIKYRGSYELIQNQDTPSVSSAGTNIWIKRA